MKVEQIYEIMNTVTGEALGETAVLAEDLSNIVQIGDTIQNVMGLDNYVKKLVDHIGRVIYVNRVYSGRTPSLLKDGWEYGSILEKISTGLPEATENESWELENGQSYDPNVFYKPEITVKFYNDKVTFEIPISITEKQVKSSFSNATQLNAFISMIHTSIQNSMTVKMNQLMRRCLNNFISEVINTNDGVTYVKLMTLYNASVDAGDQINDAEVFQRTPSAMKFAIEIFYNYIDRLSEMSELFNLGAQPRFTPLDRLSIIMLSSFKNAAQVYLDSDTFHDSYVKLPESETVVFWQGSGQSYAFSDTSKVKVTNSFGHTVDQSGIVAVMFDRDAAGVANQENHVTSNYNPKAEFWNEWHKAEVALFNDTNENFVVFAIA